MKGYNEVSAKWIHFGITFLKGYLKCITNGQTLTNEIFGFHKDLTIFTYIFIIFHFSSKVGDNGTFLYILIIKSTKRLFPETGGPN